MAEIHADLNKSFLAILFSALALTLITPAWGAQTTVSNTQSPPTSPASPTVDDDLRELLFAAVLREAEHIRRSTSATGAINMVPILGPNSDAYIRPYFATYAAIGLDIAAFLTRERDPRRALEYLQLSERFYSWYAAHMNPDGSIHDYTKGTITAPESSGDADSEDGYAGIFLYGSYIHHKIAQLIDQEKAQMFLRSMEPSLRKAAGLLIDLQKPDGLTIAKKSYPIQYLMDNLEVYAGFAALARLGLSDYTQHATRVATAINQNLWLEKGYLAWARDPQNGVTSSGWSKWYPDKLANTWAVYFSFIQPERRAGIYTTLKQEFSDPESAYSNIGPEIIYLAMAALAQRDNRRAESYIKQVLKHQGKNGGFHDSYGYTHLSGWFITAAGLYLTWNELAEIILT